jgi:tRNA nucleotidyltransferase (CCA-adding enzyme)
MNPEGLARERVYDEWKKMIGKGLRPSRGLTFLRDCGWVRYYPELAALIGCEQDALWHPEGDVWVHTLHCLDAFARERVGDPWEDLVVGLGVLCHDLGKPATTAWIDGRLRAYGHEAAGEAPTRAFLERLTNETDLIEAVVPLVLEHMRPVELYEAAAGDNAVRRLAARVKRIDRLVRVVCADQRGRPPLNVENFPAGDWLLERAQAQHIADQSPQPIVLGRHLIEMGLTPGPHFSGLLDACYEAQLDGRITNVEEGKARVQEMLDAGHPSGS